MSRSGWTYAGAGTLVLASTVLLSGACAEGSEKFPPCANCFSNGSGGSSVGGSGMGGGGLTAGVEPEWVAVFGDAQRQTPADVAGDSSGNAYVVGYYSGTIDFGGGVQVPLASMTDGFLVKLDPAGDAVWAQSFGQESSEANPDTQDLVVAVDPTGNVLVGGHIENTTTIGIANAVMYSMIAPGPDVFVAKLDPDGQHLWSQQTATQGLYTGVEGIDSDASGDVYVAGYASGTTTDVFGTITGLDFCLYVAKLDGANGDPLWVTLLPHISSYARVFDLDADDNGNVAITGYYEGDLTAGTIVLPGASTQGVFGISLDSSGNVVWARGFNAQEVQKGTGVSIGTDGVTHVAGLMRGTLDFDGTVVVADEGDLFLTSFDANGSVISVQNTNQAGNQGANDLAPGPAGTMAMTGDLTIGFNFGPLSISPNASRDMFVVKLDAGGQVDWLYGIGSSATDVGIAVAVDSASRVTAVGYIEGDVDLGSVTLPHAGGRDILVARFTP